MPAVLGLDDRRRRSRRSAFPRSPSVANLQGFAVLLIREARHAIGRSDCLDDIADINDNRRAMLNLDGIMTDQAAIAGLFRCRTKFALALILAALGSSTMPTSADERSADLVPVPRSHLCVTEGALETLPDGRILISVAKLRAVLAAPGRQAIEARFTYLGPTAETAPLRSGALRRQFGLKLRAADGCNLIYAMWRFAPKASLTVSVKSNPALHESRACGTSGYHTVEPQRAAPVEAPPVGTMHRLAATLNGDALRVLIDGRPVWEGKLGPEALAADGPIGIRSDNARLALELFAPPDSPNACPKRGDVEEGE